MKGAGLGAWRLVALAALGAAGVGLTSCASGAGATTGATVPDTTIPADNSFAVPAHITVAYVQRVLNALDAVDGDATRLIVASHTLDSGALARLQAINTPSWFAHLATGWATQIAEGLTQYRIVPGNKHDVVQQLLTSRRTCIFLKALTDYSAVSAVQQPPQVNFIELVAAPTGHATAADPTPWLVNLDGYNSAGLTPADPCGAA